MSIGDVFSKAFDLWKRDVLWLILAAFVVGLIVFAVVAVATAIVVAAGGTAVGLSVASDSVSGLSAGVIALAVVIYIVALFLVAAVSLTFYGGVFEMVIGAARNQRTIRFGDLFSGFRKFGSYLIYALVLAGIGIGMVLLFVTLIGIPIAIVLIIWISVIWLYVLPLIADHGFTFGEAQRRSRAMVKSAGWWKTFGFIILLEVAIWIVMLVFQLITSPLGNDPESAGYVVRSLISVVLYAVIAPYAICYVSVMYLESGGAAEPVPAGSPTPPPVAAPGMPPAPPAPPLTTAAPTTPVTPAPPSATPPTTTPATPDEGVADTTGETTDAAQAPAVEPPVTPPDAPQAPSGPSGPPVG